MIGFVRSVGSIRAISIRLIDVLDRGRKVKGIFLLVLL